MAALIAKTAAQSPRCRALLRGISFLLAGSKVCGTVTPRKMRGRRRALSEADYMEAQRIQFGVGLRACGLEHVGGVIANRSVAGRGHLLGQLDHAGGRCG